VKSGHIVLAPFPVETISPQNWIDDCHTNAAGYREKAAYLVPFVRRLLTNPPKMSPRPVSPQDLHYDRLSSTWHKVISNYDTQRRIETLIYDWLPEEVIRRSRILEAGCGLGFLRRSLRKFPRRNSSPRILLQLSLLIYRDGFSPPIVASLISWT